LTFIQNTHYTTPQPPILNTIYHIHRASASVALTGESRVLVSGNFSGGASVSIELDGDGLRKTAVHRFAGRDGIIVSASNTDNLTATIHDGDSDTSIDISVTAT